MKAQNPENIFINDNMLVCNQCQSELFFSSKYDPSKSGLNFPGLEWMNRSVDVFICSQCGFVHWFVSTLPSEIPTTSAPSNISSEPVTPEKDPYGISDTSECLSCGKAIPQGMDHCPSCGWTYKEPIKNE